MAKELRKGRKVTLNIPQNRLGERIKELRTETGLSQDDIGTLVGVSGAAIAQIESGSTALPKREVLWLLAYYLKTDMEDLLQAAGLLPEIPTPQGISPKIIRVLQGMDEQTQERAVAFLRSVKGLAA